MADSRTRPLSTTKGDEASSGAYQALLSTSPLIQDPRAAYRLSQGLSPGDFSSSSSCASINEGSSFKMTPCHSREASRASLVEREMSDPSNYEDRHERSKRRHEKCVADVEAMLSVTSRLETEVRAIRTGLRATLKTMKKHAAEDLDKESDSETEGEDTDREHSYLDDHQLLTDENPNEDNKDLADRPNRVYRATRKPRIPHWVVRMVFPISLVWQLTTILCIHFMNQYTSGTEEKIISISIILMLVLEFVHLLFLLVISIKLTKKLLHKTASGWYIISTYLSTIMLFAGFYTLLEEWFPNSFAGVQKESESEDIMLIIVWVRFLYFSITVMTTVGFGDISASYWYTSLLVAFQMLLSVFYTSVIFAKGIALFTDSMGPTFWLERRISNVSSGVQLALNKFRGLIPRRQRWQYSSIMEEPDEEAGLPAQHNRSHQSSNSNNSRNSKSQRASLVGSHRAPSLYEAARYNNDDDEVGEIIEH